MSMIVRPGDRRVHLVMCALAVLAALWLLLGVWGLVAVAATVS